MSDQSPVRGGIDPTQIAPTQMGTGAPDQMPEVPNGSYGEALAGAAVGGMVRARQATEMLLGAYDWLADPLLGAEVGYDDFKHIVGDRPIQMRPGMRVGEVKRAVSQYDYDYVRSSARSYGLTSWYGDLTASLIGGFFTDPAQVVGAGAGRLLKPGLAMLPFSRVAQYIAGPSHSAAGVRFGVTLAPELAFEKTLAGYTGKEYGLADAGMDAVGELLLEGVMHGVDIAVGDGPDAIQWAGKKLAEGKAAVEQRLGARREKVAAPSASVLKDVTPSDLPTLAESMSQTDAMPEQDLPPTDVYDQAPEADPQPGHHDQVILDEPKNVKKAAGRKKAALPEERLDVIMAHTELVNRGIDVTVDEVRAEFERAEQAVKEPPMTEPKVEKEIPGPDADYTGVEPDVHMTRDGRSAAVVYAGPDRVEVDQVLSDPQTPAEVAAKAEIEKLISDAGSEHVELDTTEAKKVIDWHRAMEGVVETKATAKTRKQKASKQHIDAKVANELAVLPEGLTPHTSILDQVERLGEQRSLFNDDAVKLLGAEEGKAMVDKTKADEGHYIEVVQKALACAQLGKK